MITIFPVLSNPASQSRLSNELMRHNRKFAIQNNSSVIFPEFTTFCAAHIWFTRTCYTEICTKEIRNMPRSKFECSVETSPQYCIFISEASVTGSKYNSAIDKLRGRKEQSYLTSNFYIIWIDEDGIICNFIMWR